MMRTEYTHQLGELRGSIVAMGSMVDKAVGRATEAVTRQDVRVAQEVIVGDEAINAQRRGIEDLALRIIATQAPMAGDLRSIAAALHISTDLERMGDHAAGIAKLVIESAGEPLLKPLVDLPRMAEVTRRMQSDAIMSFVASNPDLARRTAEQDDVVDALYDQVYRELLTYMMADPGTINRATHLLWTAHNFERIADRITNICERVIFAASGSLEEVNVSSR